MHSLVQELLDRFGPLSRTSSWDHQRLLTEVAEPLYAAFQELHEAFLRSFRGYRADVAQWSTYTDHIEGFCEQLDKEHLPSAAIRRQLWEFSHTDIRPVLRNFIQTLGGYVESRATEIDRRSGVSPIIRPPGATELVNLKNDATKSEEERIRILLTFLDRVLARAVAQAEHVAKEYAWQRTKLLR
jgi:hypothetical protein